MALEDKRTIYPAVTAIPGTAKLRSPGNPRSNRVKLARLVSLVLHPFLISPLSIVLILWLDQGNLRAAVSWAALCAAFVVGPAGFYLWRKLKQKKFTDADVSVREQRYGFYLFGGVCMLACFGVLLWFNAPSVLVAGFSAALVALIVAVLINRYMTKVSIHAGAMAGVAVAAAYYSWPLAMLLIAGTLIVSWARLVTERHTAAQAVLGWGVAAVCVIGVFGPLLSII